MTRAARALWLAAFGVSMACAWSFACSPFGDASPADADASSGVPTSGEGGADAPPGDDAMAPGTSFCGMFPYATICSDFDGADPLAKWKQDVTGGMLMVNATRPRSAPKSLRATLGGGVQDTARLVVDFPRTSKHVRLSFEVDLVFAGLTDASKQVSLAEVYCADATGFNGVWIFVKGDASTLKAVHDGDQEELLPSLKSGFTKIVIDAHLDLRSTTVTVGTGATAVTMAKLCGTYAVTQVIVGLSTISSVRAEAFYDNVVYELEPP